MLFINPLKRDMQVDLTRIDDAAVVKLTGAINRKNITHLSDIVSDQLQKEAHVVIDFRNVKKFESSPEVINAMTAFDKWAAESGNVIVLSRVAEDVAAHTDNMYLSQLFDMYDSLEGALISLKKAAV